MRLLVYSLPTLLILGACTIKGVNLTALETEGGVDESTGDPTDGTTTSQISGNPGSDATSEGTTSEPTDETTTGAPSARPLDLLFIVDNSGSMSEKQARLAASAQALVDAAGDRDIRVGITTTDVGNPRCPNATYTPEVGVMSTASCRERVAADEFVFNGSDLSSACLDHCAHETLTVTPTTTAEDPALKARPWFERTAGIANVNVPLDEAISCSVLQGVAGCGFESPLAAMELALTRAMTASEAQHGFIRAEADLKIVILTDEMDCSYEPAAAEIFTTNDIFWNPDDPAPTSAVCFRAGSQCQLTPDAFECHAIDRDLTGAITDDPSAAVLRPVSVYVDALNAIKDGKTGGATVQMIVIAGVPPGFENTGELEDIPPPSPEYELDFGVTPGCVDGTAYAVPPLRILDVGQGFGAAKFFSICEPDFDAALGAAGGL